MFAFVLLGDKLLSSICHCLKLPCGDDIMFSQEGIIVLGVCQTSHLYGNASLSFICLIHGSFALSIASLIILFSCKSKSFCFFTFSAILSAVLILFHHLTSIFFITSHHARYAHSINHSTVHTGHHAALPNAIAHIACA
jgi:hypothetical protein